MENLPERPALLPDELLRQIEDDYSSEHAKKSM
jgi:hypothetical protein